jgi:hypothetical protein
MCYTGLAQNLEVVGHRALRHGRVEGAARHLVDPREHPHYVEPNRIAQCVKDVGKAHVFDSWVIEVPHSLASSTVDEPPKRIATESGTDQGGEF